jgi:hypothetical protein
MPIINLLLRIIIKLLHKPLYSPTTANSQLLSTHPLRLNLMCHTRHPRQVVPDHTVNHLVSNDLRVPMELRN